MNQAASATQRPVATSWGDLGGRPVSLYRLDTHAGMRALITDYGAALVGLEVPDAAGGRRDVVLGFDAFDGDALGSYRQAQSYFGAVIGRVANRIGRARFRLDGAEHTLAANEGGHQLHGGPEGFDRRLWAAQPVASSEGPALALSLVSPDGDQGFPGTVVATALYRLLEPATLRLELSASCDRPTAVSLSNHSYFNLAGHDAGSVLDHELTVHAEAYTPTDEKLLPTGEIRLVAGSAFDFREPARLGGRMAAPELRHPEGRGYDTNLVLTGGAGGLRLGARLRAPAGGLAMELWTTQPGLQVYSANGFDGSLVGKGGARYARYAGLALEPQGFPNAVNTPHFPQVWLRPGESYRHVIEYRFDAGGIGPGRG